MKVLLIDQQTAMHLTRVHSTLQKPRNRQHFMQPAFTKDDRYIINACVLGQKEIGQRFAPYVNILDWIKGSVIDVTQDEVDNANWGILLSHAYTLDDLKVRQVTNQQDNLSPVNITIDGKAYQGNSVSINGDGSVVIDGEVQNSVISDSSQSV